VSEFLTTVHIADLVLGVMALEAVALLIYWRRKRRGIPPAAVFVNLAAGACLVLALRSVLAGSHWVWTAAWLAAAFLTHLADLAHRWRR